MLDESPPKSKRGVLYPIINLYDSLKKKNKIFLMHRLLAITFIPNPLNLPEVDHINRNKLDYSLENLFRG